MIIDHVARVVGLKIGGRAGLTHLDMGAGWCHLIQALRRILPGVKSSGCDYNPSHFPLADVPVVHADFSRDTLPYADESFELVTFTEVFKHLENFRYAVREAARLPLRSVLSLLTDRQPISPLLCPSTRPSAMRRIPACR